MSGNERIARVARGKRPRYFSDPAIDKLHAMLMTVVGELSVVRERLDALERLLDQKGTVSRADLNAFVPDDRAEAERREQREAYIGRILRVVEMELEEIRAGREQSTVEEIYERLIADE